MQRTFLRCAALWIMGLSCTARADPVMQGLVVATLGFSIVGQALGKAPSHEDRASLMVEGGRLDVEPIGNRYRWSIAINGGPLHVSRDDPMRPGLPCVRRACLPFH